MAGKKVVNDFARLSDNVSFAYIIHKLAQFDGARWWVDPKGQFNYVPIGTPVGGTYSIFVNMSDGKVVSDCLALDVTRNIPASKGKKVHIKSWNPRQKRVFEHEATINGNGGPIPYNYHIPNLHQDQVAKYARSMATEHARHELKVSATVVGDSSVFAGMGLRLSGTTYFDQTFDIDTVHHAFGMSGYTTSITARAAKAGRSVT
jgi:hypothetical protein